MGNWFHVILCPPYFMLAFAYTIFFFFPFSWFRVLTLLSRVGDPLGRNKISKEIYLAVFVCQVDQSSNIKWISSTHFLPHCVLFQFRQLVSTKATCRPMTNQLVYIFEPKQNHEKHISNRSAFWGCIRGTCVVLWLVVWYEKALLTCVCVTLMWYESLKFLGISTLKGWTLAKNIYTKLPL